MSLTALRHALRPQRDLWRNLLVTVATAATIMAGLLAMHSLNLEHTTGESTVASATAPAHHAGMAIGDNPAGIPGDCAGPCTPEHSMMTMVCILALLVSLLLIGAVRVVAGWKPFWRWAASIAERVAALPLPAPPSLYALSISRT